MSDVGAAASTDQNILPIQTLARGGALMYHLQSTASFCCARFSLDIWVDSTKPSGPVISNSQTVQKNILVTTNASFHNMWKSIIQNKLAIKKHYINKDISRVRLFRKTIQMFLRDMNLNCWNKLNTHMAELEVPQDLWTQGLKAEHEIVNDIL